MMLELDTTEMLELINMHAQTLVMDCVCADCGAPVKQTMLLKLERIRELILALPDHLTVDEDLQRGKETMQ